MSVNRIIYRLDFNLNYDIVEQPGQIMKLLDRIADDDYVLKENMQRRGVASVFTSTDGKVITELTVEPQTIVVSYENAEGIDLDKILIDETFLSLTKLTGKVCEKYHINDINRSGFRIFYFGSIQNNEAAFNAYRSFYDTDLIDVFENFLGDIQDYAVHFNGASTEGIKYHCKTGPLKKDENYNAYFQNMSPDVLPSDNWGFIVDIDLYEENIAISNIPIHKWFRPKIEKATELINNIGLEVEKRKGN